MTYADHAAADLQPITTSRTSLSDAHATHEPITGWHALQGLPLGILRGLAPGCDVQVSITDVVESSTDLAVADRVAYLAAHTSGANHVVLAGAHGYLVVTLSVELDWAAAMRLEHAPIGFRIISVATAEGVLPVLNAA